MARSRTKTGAQRKTSGTRGARPTAAGEGPTSSARGSWIDEVDRVAKRPFLEGDYLPGAGQGAPKRRSR